MKIGNNFNIPKKYKNDKIIDVGGYKIIISESEGVLVQGINLVNLYSLPITNVGITPLDEEMQNSINNFPFDIEKHHLVYQILFNNFAWYFNNKADAFELLDFILRVKENALNNKFLFQ